jgi:hypothetical protein
VNYVMRQGKLIEVVAIETVAGRRKARRQEPFAMVPLAWAASAAKATRTPKALVWVLLLHTAWRTRTRDLSAVQCGAGGERGEQGDQAPSAGGTGSRRTDRSRAAAGPGTPCDFGDQPSTTVGTWR